ncbi:TIGR03862 family flavoprotein [Rubrimonas cliftonensis]|nr:TIGR03862 family flavoprotein [Rubrimonas cliftonensis]
MSAGNPINAVIVGAGPAGLAAAETLAQGGARVTVLERMPSAARKFLMAGRGGLNLTHAEPEPVFRARYGGAAVPLAAALDAFPPQALRDWADGLGAETFTGSSGRVFPKAMKASPLLRAWLRRLEGLGVRLVTRARWTGFVEGGVSVEGAYPIAAQAVVLACGGASWPRLGSDGRWTAALPPGAVAPLVPANCGFRVDWPEGFAARWAGVPLKGAAFSHGGTSLRGEATVTAQGVEGGAIYALSAALRESVARDGAAALAVDLKPDLSAAKLAAKLEAQRPGLSRANRLRRLGLSPLAAALARLGGEASKPEALAAAIKAVPLRLTATAGLERAISTAGGLRWDALDATLMLRDRPGVFACGEMLDWEAPTGGYLLQASIATGRLAGSSALDWLSREAPPG